MIGVSESDLKDLTPKSDGVTRDDQRSTRELRQIQDLYPGENNDDSGDKNKNDEEIKHAFVEEKFTKMSNKLIDIMSNSILEDEDLTGYAEFMRNELITEVEEGEVRQINHQNKIRSHDSNYGSYQNFPLASKIPSGKQSHRSNKSDKLK